MTYLMFINLICYCQLHLNGDIDNINKFKHQ